MPIDIAIAEGIPSLVSPFITEFFVLMTRLGDWHVVAAFYLIVAGYYLVTNRKRSAELLTVLILSLTLSFFLKYLFGRERPDIFRVSTDVFSSSSFPSAHATTSIAFYGYLGYLMLQHTASKWWRVVVIALVTALVWLIGFSRIYLGVHWFTDVLAGWILGLAILIPMISISKKRRLVAAEKPAYKKKQKKFYTYFP
jgi:membrane-associated phospholipid phosphatase